MMKKTSASLVKLVNFLNDQAFHSGTEIGEHCHISRAAVWKIIRQLQNYSVKIESAHGKGYRLCEPLILLDEKLIKQKGHFKAELAIFETLGSTNDYLKQNLKKLAKNQVCLAERQVQGRGRMGRQWASPFAKNIYFSYLWQTNLSINELGPVSLIVGLCVAKTMREFGLDAKLKWPNDIICHDKKMAGVLIELSGEMHNFSNLVIGIGINVNMLVETSITQAWTSMQMANNQYIDRNEVVAKLLEFLPEYLNQFEKSGFQAFMPEWQQYDYLRGKNISLQVSSQKFSGKAVGVNEQGYLMLETEQGYKTFSSGEASLIRPIE